MLKKIAVSVLALSLCTALFSGCWWNKDKSPSSTPSSYSQSMTNSVGNSTSMSGSTSTSMSDNLPGSMSGSTSGSMSGSLSGGNSGSLTTSSSGSMSTSTSNTAAANAAAASFSWQTRIVNASNPLPEDFEVEIEKIRGYDDRTFDARAATALEAMLSAAEESGNKLYLVSAYRSVARQKALFSKKVNFYINKGQSKNDAELSAAKWVARAGTSEHNLGLAADIVSADWYKSNNDLTTEFENTSAFKWLISHCADYGFVLRYPKGKTEITGIEYEPWHYRYVGLEAAKIIMSKGQALEEYAKE